MSADKFSVKFHAGASAKVVTATLKALKSIEKAKGKVQEPDLPHRDESSGGTFCLLCGGSNHGGSSWAAQGCPVLKPILERQEAREKGEDEAGTIVMEAA